MSTIRNKTITIRLQAVVVVLTGLICGNFAWQAMNRPHDWSQAVERSWFEVVAFAMMFIIAVIDRSQTTQRVGGE